MAAPVGQWHIDANGFKGTLNITADPAGHVGGSVNIDIGVTDGLQGTWNEVAQEVTFHRVRNGNFFQTYTGCLFTTKEPIFGGQGPPEPHPTFRMLAGSFESLGTPGRPRFGWVARQTI
jgi:hypothetical protein